MRANRWAWVGALAIVVGCGGSSNSGTGPTDGGAASGGTGNSGGSGATGGGGTGGVPFVPASKVDVLLMVDNSISMADKQAVLSDTLASFLQALTNPPVDTTTGKPYFAPLTDIHLGVISSSLGGHGSDVCSEAGPSFLPTQNDRAHLMPSVRSGLSSFQGEGFLWWDPQNTNGGETEPAVIAADFQAHVQASGEQGCGFEASLEAWYRFLIDSAPPMNVVVQDNMAVLDGVDSELLQQRADFLRPDSAVVIVSLSDENDCSTIDGGLNWIAGQITSPGSQAFHLPRAASACNDDPNSPCCRSCQSVETNGPPAGCSSLDTDPQCAQGSHDDSSDHPNLRCYDQKRRFGLDFLYPVQRYVDALSNPVILDRDGDPQPNPLLLTRSRELVSFVTITGVPWQDIATPDSLAGGNLEYLSPSELAAQGRWDWLIPECAVVGTNGVCEEWSQTDEPDDPLMIESSTPRSGTNPATNQALQDPNGPLFSPSGIPNGHEFANPNNNELQYACIFELLQPRDCEQVSQGTGCDCTSYVEPSVNKNPLCQQSDGSYTTIQRYAKGFPGTRFLQVARDIGNQAVVASVCPKSLDPSSAAYGYNPAVNALVKRLADILVPAS